jgi:hypothetical protein
MPPRKTRAAASTATARANATSTRSSKRGTTIEPEAEEVVEEVIASDKMESATTAPKRATRSTRSTRNKAAPSTEVAYSEEPQAPDEPDGNSRRGSKREATIEVEELPKAKKANGGSREKGKCDALASIWARKLMAILQHQLCANVK